MITRREINSALAFTTVLSAPGAALRAQTPAAGPHGPHMRSVPVRTLMQEPLGDIADPQVTVITLTVPPGSVSPPHRHTGPVFAYILEGRIENQVDPDPPKTYHAGDFFYEPAMHVHRSLRNLSRTQSAKLLIFEVGEKGKAFTIGAK